MQTIVDDLFTSLLSNPAPQMAFAAGRHTHRQPVHGPIPIAEKEEIEMSHPRIIGIENANPALMLTQEQAYPAVWYQSERIRKMFLNSDIDYRNFYQATSIATRTRIN